MAQVGRIEIEQPCFAAQSEPPPAPVRWQDGSRARVYPEREQAPHRCLQGVVAECLPA